jgi:hypothetical protein
MGEGFRHLVDGEDGADSWAAVMRSMPLPAPFV